MTWNHDRGIRRMSLPLALSFVLLGSHFARADFLLPNHAHSQKVTNNTGKAANDLHVNVPHVTTGGGPTAPPFTPAATGSHTIDLSGGSVPNGGSATVSWQSKFASDTVDPTDPGNWTLNGADIGALAVASLDLKPQYQDLGGGVILASILNNGPAVSYSDLQVFNDANSAFFAPSTFVSGLTSGVPVSLLASSSGVFAPGLTNIAQFSPSTNPSFYAGGSVLVDGDLFAHAGSAVPEPSSMALLGIGMLVVGWKYRFRK